SIINNKVINLVKLAGESRSWEFLLNKMAPVSFSINMADFASDARFNSFEFCSLSGASLDSVALPSIGVDNTNKNINRILDVKYFIIILPPTSDIGTVSPLKKVFITKTHTNL